MNGGGPGSGIWKSTDGGETWTRLKGGVLDGPLGRIALDVYRKRPNILYALIEGPTPPAGAAAAAAPAAGEEGPGAAPAAPQEAPGGGRGARRRRARTPQPTGLYRSDDAGATWRKVNNANPRPMYFSQVRIDPNDPEVVYLGGVDLHQTLDGGKTINTAAASSDPRRPPRDLDQSGQLESRPHRQRRRPRRVVRHAKTWNFLPNLPVGLFYHVSYDMATPYNVCGGMQDNYSWCGPSAGARHRRHRQPSLGDDAGRRRLRRAAGSDRLPHRLQRVAGRQHRPRRSRDRRDDVDPAARRRRASRRCAGTGTRRSCMSPHDPKVVYAAANKVFRSPDRGLSWVAVSPDLTTNAESRRRS